MSEAYDILSGREALRLVLAAAARGAQAGGRLAGGGGPGASAVAGLGFGLTGMLLAAGGVSVALGLWAVGKMSGILLAKVRRPRYYARERVRRARLARVRRRVRDRFTTGPCPKPEELLAQYGRAGSGAREAIRFGSMLCDLEAYCDNSLLRNAGGEIVGRNPGVKGWLRENCPGLLAHYKNAMRYKGLAEKFRQAAGAADPVPAAALAGEDAGAALRPLGGRGGGMVAVRMRKANGRRRGKTVSGTYALEAGALSAAWECARGMLCECEKAAFGGRRGKGDGVGGEAARRRGEVARLGRVVDRRLGGMPAGRLNLARWRAGVATAGTGPGRTSA